MNYASDEVTVVQNISSEIRHLYFHNLEAASVGGQLRIYSTLLSKRNKKNSKKNIGAWFYAWASGSRIAASYVG